MIAIIRSDQRHHRDFGWLDARWHISFSDYHDPQNMSWGPLRVFNDDVIAPGRGFDLHPHRDMEIITYVVEGGLRHQDSTGNNHVTSAGGVQVMSAGKGIMHGEFNASQTLPVHLLQLWIIPRTKGATPRWDQRSFVDALGAGEWVTVVSDGSAPGSLAIDQDATVRVARVPAGKTLSASIQPGRRAYAFVIGGEIELNGQPLSAGDQARVVDETALKFVAGKASELILLDLPR